MTGDAARRHLAEESRKLRELAGLLKTTPKDAAERLAAVLEERRKLERELAEARKRLAMGGGAAGADPTRDVAGVKFLGRAVTGVEMKDLKGLADEAKKQVGSGVVAIVGVAEDGRPARSSGSPRISPPASMRWRWCARPPKRWAARAAAAAAISPRPAGLTAPRPRRR